jgi:uncharacterized protein YjbI with pentapeptide repeats
LKIEVNKKGSIPPADLRLLVIDHETLASQTFAGLRLDGLKVIESSLSHCAFDDVRARSCSFGEGVRQSVFEDCAFTRCTLVFGAVGHARLVRCRFESSRLENLFGSNLEVIDCAFPGTTLKKSVFHGRIEGTTRIQPQRVVNEIRGNDFSQAELDDVDFRGGVDLTKQRLPSGEGYIFVADTCKALAIVKELQRSIVDAAELKRSKTLAGLLDFYCSNGQTTQLLQVDRRGAFERELAARLS